MAPYVPQNAHYAHLDVCEYPIDDLYAFVGRGGRRFYRLTRQLGLKYLWFNPDSKVIEVWGPFESLRDLDPVRVVREELQKFVSQRSIRGPESDGDHDASDGPDELPPPPHRRAYAAALCSPCAPRAVLSDA